MILNLEVRITSSINDSQKRNLQFKQNLKDDYLINNPHIYYISLIKLAGGGQVEPQRQQNKINKNICLF